MIRYLTITGKNITRGLTCGIRSANGMIKQSGAIATIINHRPNSACGRSYLSSDGVVLDPMTHYNFGRVNDQVVYCDGTLYAHAILSILGRKLYIATI